MKRQEKLIYGRTILELYKVMEIKVQRLEEEIDKKALYSNSYHSTYESPLKQMEDIIDIIMRLDKLNVLNNKLKEAAANISEDLRLIFLCHAHPDPIERSILKKKTMNKYKYRMTFYRMVDKMLIDLYDNFFIKEWNITYFIKHFNQEKLINNAIKYSRIMIEKTNMSESVNV